MSEMRWRELFSAFLIHLLVTALIVGLVAFLVFVIWFPGPFARMVGGLKLFLLLVACNLTLGPLLSLVIYNGAKPRKVLLGDYLVVGVLQLAALVYGVSVAVESRPIFIAFTKDRLEIVIANELEDADLAVGTEPRYRRRSWMGPQLVSVELPTVVGEQYAVVMSAALGKDVQLMPKYYRPYETMLPEIKRRGLPIKVLIEQRSQDQQQIKAAVKASKLREDQLLWLPVHNRFGFWTVLIDANTGYPVIYLPIDPPDVKFSAPINAIG
jgi:hypothetical protein